MTIIDFSHDIKEILNFDELPIDVQKAIKEAEVIESRGFQELIGLQGRKLIFSAGGHWLYHDEAMEHPKGFVIDSIGAKYYKDLTGGGNISFVELQWSDK